MTDSKPVARLDCDSKHKLFNRLIGLVFVIIALMATGVAWSVKAGNTAQSDTANVQLEFRVHMAQQAGEMGKVEMCLNRIEDICKENREELKEQRRRIETLMRTYTGPP